MSREVGGLISRRMKQNGTVRTACSLCQNLCGIIAYVSDGKIVKLEGDPANPRNQGHLCAKGLSGFVTLSSPRRVTRPLMRTERNKSLGVDPKWKPISWDEAIDIVSAKLRAVRDHASNLPASEGEARITAASQRIIFDTFDHWVSRGGIERSWANALGAYQGTMSAACFCGNAVHPPSYLNTSTFEITVDPEYSKYVLLIGAQAGSIIHYDTMNVARHIAENRPGNVKVVSVDPMAGYAGSRAEEWVPIRPGTDAALILGLVNLLLNEYSLYDVEFIKKKTNGPYLIGADSLYVRDPASDKPLVWDAADGRAKTWDDKTIRDPALEGSYDVGGRRATPGFQLVKDHVKSYTPDRVSEITTIPAETIRRLAKEIGEAACIGQTIKLEGKELPYRPVSIVWYRGISAHRHSFLVGLAAILLPTILGAIQVPGAIRGHPPAPEYVSPDGLLATTSQARPTSGPPYPPRNVSRPRRADVFELFPVAVYSSQIIPVVLEDPSRFGVDMKEFVWPEMMFIYRDNPVKNSYSPSQVIHGLSKIPFIVSFNVDLDETANSLADIVFPDLHHLEKLGESLYLRVGEPGYWYAGKPVVQPPFEKPWDGLVSNAQVLLEIAKRAGFLNELYAALNQDWKLRGTAYELDPAKAYGYEELIDRRLKAWLGPEKGLDWLMSDEGGLIVSQSSLPERYRGAFRQARIHLYFEFMENARKMVEKTARDLGMTSWDTSDYQPIPDWKPCPAFANRKGVKDLFLINYKIPMMAHSVGRTNPVPMQLVAKRKHLDRLLMHPSTAAKLGISDGDAVLVEDKRGSSQESLVHLTERIHPEVVASSQHRLKSGLDFNRFATLEGDAFDFVGGAIDSCVLVEVKKAGPD